MRRLAIRRNNNRRAAPANKTPINGEIRAKECRLILPNGEQAGIVQMRDALEAAEEVGLDLVQIADSDPIVCKVMDYGKKQYEEKKAKAAAKKKQVQTTVKEIKFRPNTDIGDYNIKLGKMTNFLEHGDKVKVTLRFRGREMAHQDIGRRLLERIEKDLEELANVEQRAKMEGRQMVMVMAPSKKK